MFVCFIFLFSSIFLAASQEPSTLDFTPQEMKAYEFTESLADTPQKLREIVQLSLPELNAEYGEGKGYPLELVKYLYGIKVLNGVGCPKNRELAFKFFLKAVPRVNQAASTILDMCSKEFCYEDEIRKELTQGVSVGRNMFLLLDKLGSHKKVSPELREEIKRTLRDISAQRPDLVFVKASTLKDTSQSFKIIEKLAQENYEPAIMLLAEWYEFGEHTGTLNIAIDFKKSLELYERAAALGSKMALFKIGTFYYVGKGVPRDVKKSFEIIEEAARYNVPEAWLDLGVFYTQGIGVDQDLEKAIEYFKKAADVNNGKGIAALAQLAFSGVQDDGSLDEPDYNKAFILSKKAVDLGNISAGYNLAFFYKSGLFCKVDNKKAQELYDKILKSENSADVAYQALMYEDGVGTEKNLYKARDCYKKSIDAGNTYYTYRLERIEKTLAEGKDSSQIDPVDSIEIPEYMQQASTSLSRQSSRQQSRNKVELDAHSFLKSQEIDFKRKLNERFFSSDGSEIQDINLNNGKITVVRPEDGTVCTIEMPENKRRKMRAGKLIFNYLDRVKKWFDELPLDKQLPPKEYNSMIRHAFPQKIDVLARLFGTYTVSPDEKKYTLALRGELIPGKTKEPISGTFVYGYTSNSRGEYDVYHRFMHKDTCMSAIA